MWMKGRVRREEPEEGEEEDHGVGDGCVPALNAYVQMLHCLFDFPREKAAQLSAAAGVMGHLWYVIPVAYHMEELGRCEIDSECTHLEWEAYADCSMLFHQGIHVG